jgi:ribosomal protein S6--L-glutamate ligase
VSVGGESRPYRFGEACLQFCREVMERGKFPYAHLDLLMVDQRNFYLSEIALNAGTRGARIDRKELDRKKQDLLVTLADDFSKSQAL